MKHVSLWDVFKYIWSHEVVRTTEYIGDKPVKVTEISQCGPVRIVKTSQST